MRVLGLDVGDKKIGVAVSDELGLIAQGIGVITRQDLKQDLKKIEELIQQYNVGKVILGLPRNMNGTLGSQGEAVKKFGEALKQNSGIELGYWDERLSTVEAERSLIDADMSRRKRKGVIDKVAAVLILQGYLNYRCHVDTE
ncbi:MAG: putative pre6S rRNA nuclease [Thermoanaerobacteraceae bacterium]|jgi:putative Holliday junction resolvase|nr:putative pre6S rRNA nuclease [Thermoanaerobacteraceae bacterium]